MDGFEAWRFRRRARTDATHPATTIRVQHPFPTGGSMETPQQRTLDAGRRVQVFLDTFAAIIGALVSAALREKLDDAVASLAGFGLEQKTAGGLVQGETMNELRLRTELYDCFVLPVVRASK